MQACLCAFLEPVVRIRTWRGCTESQAAFSLYRRRAHVVARDGRYEDTVLVPGQTVSAGVCLESFVVATTDSAFVPQFIDRTGNDRWRTRVRVFAQRFLLALVTSRV